MKNKLGMLPPKVNTYGKSLRRLVRGPVSKLSKFFKTNILPHPLLSILGLFAFVLLVILVLRIFDVWGDFWDCRFGSTYIADGPSIKAQTLRMLGFGLFGLVGVCGLIVAHMRVQAHFQSNREVIFNKAITHLGNGQSVSARLGGIYGLYSLLSLEPDRLQNIADILCAHLRETTQQKEYRETYEDTPSNEVQSLLNVLGRINKKFGRPDPEIPLLDLSNAYLFGADLTKIDLHGAKLHWTNFGNAMMSAANLQHADLQHAQLQKANLSNARLQEANLSNARLQEANLSNARLQEANLSNARLQGTDLSKAQLQKAHLWGAELQGAELWGAELQGTNLRGAKLQGAELWDARLQGANLHNTQLQGANLQDARLQGANLQDARLQGVNLSDARLQGADLENANLQGADLSNAWLPRGHLKNADLQGAFSKEGDTMYISGDTLETRINAVRGKATALESTVFGGGMDAGELEKIESDLKENGLLEEKIKEIIERIRPHVEQEKSYKLPPSSKATTGKLTNKMADKIIADYKKAMESES